MGSHLYKIKNKIKNKNRIEVSFLSRHLISDGESNERKETGSCTGVLEKQTAQGTLRTQK